MIAVIHEVLVSTLQPTIAVKVSRNILYKRRWRAFATDQTELAVDLPAPAQHGNILRSHDERFFLIEQIPEDLLVIPTPNRLDLATQLGWYLGNQHLPIEVRNGEILLEDLSTLRASLNRIGIPYTPRQDIFHCKIPSHSHAL
jgi:urease accessory protein UreE